MTENHTMWGPWISHDGSGMPVQAGSIVEVRSDEDPKTARNGIVQRVGVAGVDLVRSWRWAPETRSSTRSLPIDRYRVKRPKGLDVLAAMLAEQQEFEHA